MGPFCHLGVTSVLLAGDQLFGGHLSPEIIAASFAGGVLIDGDKVFEIYHDKIKKLPPDITARSRVLHSIFAFPFAILLGFISCSLLPLFAVLLHIAVDSLIPGLEKDGKHHPSHSPWKWITIPFMVESWHKIVPRGWPIEYPAKLNLLYKLAEPIGMIITVFSVFLIF